MYFRCDTGKRESALTRRLPLLAITFVAASVLLGQDITGTWQGTIHTTRDFREVIKIAQDGNVFKATLFAIDSQPGLIFSTRPGQSFSSGTVVLQGKLIKIQFPGIGGGYQGTLSADGTSILGGLLQNGVPLTLNLTRATAQSAWEIPDASLPEKPMATDADPSFEVASIKPTPPNARGGGLGPSPGGRFTVHNMTVGALVLFAYGVNRSQIKNEPSWFETERVDIVAKADMTGSPTLQQMMTMMQKLFADRLNLRVHREKKEGGVFALTVQNPGKLTPNQGDPSGPAPAGINRRPGHWQLTAINLNMETFALGLQTNVLDRPVLDRTGLTGRFDITLDWTPDELQYAALDPTTPAVNSAPAFPDLYTALRDQLGLKLESTKGPVDVIVIDHVERPSDN